MKPITSKLALSQLKNNRKRTLVTVLGIVLSAAMLTAVAGFAASGIETMRRLVGDNSVAAYAATLVSLAAVLGAIIMAASVVVISNAFRISASERTRQFGILKSVGATSKQITQIVLYEAVYLAAISIPLGIIAGLLIQWLGTSIGDALLAPMNKLINEDLSMQLRFEFSWLVIAVAAGTSILTVLVSAWLPARRAAKLPAIEAIRLSQDIRVSGGRLRTGRLVEALFGFEGTLAAKSIKRSRRSYRAMVAALAISIVLFLTCASLDSMMTLTLNQVYINIDANSYSMLYAYRSGGQTGAIPLDQTVTAQVTQALRTYPDTEIFGAGVDSRYAVSAQDPALTDTLLKTLEPEQTQVNVALVAPDREHYEALCEAAGVPVGSNILINSAQRVVGGKTTEFQPLRFSGQSLTLEADGEQSSLPIAAQLTGAQVPQEILFAADMAIAVVVPECQARMYVWFGLSQDLPGFIVYAEDTLDTLGTSDGESEGYACSVTDITAVTDMTRGLTRLITVFLYGFVGMLSLIGLTSVIAAISANVQLRAREFAVLKSTGMTERGVRRMLALESVMSAFRALLYGIPLGTAGAYLVYIALTSNVRFGFAFPWLALLEVILGVFIIALIVTQYAAKKLRGGSIIEAIRMGEGV